jgi:hypothetical protein
VGYFEKGENRDNWKKELEELTTQREQKSAGKEPVVKEEKEPAAKQEKEPAVKEEKKPAKPRERAPEKASEAAPKQAAVKPANSKRVAITFEQLEAEAFGRAAPSKAADKMPSISKNISKSK